jgi:5-hydroxyisourate hydrolase
MSPITTHVLDTVSGRPAAGIAVTLEFGGKKLAQSVTDADGRARNLLAAEYRLDPGTYCLRFQTAAISAFFPEIEIHFRVENPEQHYHVPLLLSAYGYTTYRGS